jgi:hypothetical protein
MKQIFTSLKHKIEGLSLEVVLPVFLLNLVLEMKYFFPSLGQINVWDEATYIHTGYALLTKGIWPNLAGSPLSSLMYALSLWSVSGSRDFFVLGNAIARIFLFVLIFFSAYLIARALRPYANPWIMVGLLFIVPIASTMYLFPSDVLFAGFSGLAFWQMLVFYTDRKRRHLWWASGFMGIGMLARAEGLILAGVMLVVTLVIILPKRTWYRDVLAVTLPFAIIVGGFVLAYGLGTGDFGTGLQERTFNNFESGHEGIYSHTGIFSTTVSARLESGEVFGNAEENNFSVFRAIRRNPQVYFARLRDVFPSFVAFAIKAYGNKFILVFLWLGLRGLIELIQKKHIPLVVMSLGWFLPMGVGFLNTFFREGYFTMPYFVVFTLVTLGLSAILDNFKKKPEKIALVAASLMVLGISLLARNTSMLYRNALFIFGLGFLYLLKNHQPFAKNWRVNALWLLLALGLIIRGGYPSPELPAYGKTDLDRSVYFLQEELPNGSQVLAGAPAYIWAARMRYGGINSFDIPEFANEEEFLRWIRVQDIKAVYVDRFFPATFSNLVNSLVGEGLREVYTTPNREIVIYFVTEDGS